MRSMWKDYDKAIDRLNYIIRTKGIEYIMEKKDMSNKKDLTFKKDESKRVVLHWDTKQGKNKFGLFEATIWDNNISDVKMCKNGSSVSYECLTVSSGVGSEDFLREVHRCLGELLAYLDENK